MDYTHQYSRFIPEALMKLCDSVVSELYCNSPHTLNTRAVVSSRVREHLKGPSAMQESTSDLPQRQPSISSDRCAYLLADIKAIMGIEDMPDDLLEFLIVSMYKIIVIHGLEFNPQSWLFAWQYLKDAGVIVAGGA